MLTSAQLAPSSSATTLANAVPTCCPISALAILIKTLPSALISNQTEGENNVLGSLSASGAEIDSTASCSLQPANREPSPMNKPVLTEPARKERLETSVSIEAACISLILGITTLLPAQLLL